MLRSRLMGVLRPDRPLSPRQHRLKRVVLVVSVLIGVALGVEWARECAAIPSAYLADYSYAISFYISVYLSVFGLLLLIYWRTRVFGAGLIAVGVLSYVMFLGGMAVLLKRDRVAWRHEQIVSYGPEQKASAVIYFHKGIALREVEDFNSSVLQEPSTRHQGRGYPPFVQSYFRLAPTQANGHEAIAIRFFDSAPSDEVNAYLATIKADSRVEGVYLNTSPDAITSEHQ
jgi:hypothetical protein